MPRPYTIMRNIKLTIEYDGTHFEGWQIQKPSSRTVQQELEKACLKIFKERTHVHGSGRTDSGVHALGQVANLKTKSRMKTPEILKAFNAALPEDIALTNVAEVSKKFHAQFSAKSKIYRYTILNRTARSALKRNFCLFYPYRLNLARMRQEAKTLIGLKDFRSFQATDSSPRSANHNKNTVRRVKRLDVGKKGDLISIEIEANGFLYKMVRNIVGTLLETGSGKLPKGSIKSILSKKNRAFAGKTAPAKGLCLIQVKY